MALNIAPRRGGPVRTAGGILLAVVLVPNLVGHPVVSYASSASMVPTFAVGDGFLVNPFARHAAVGDIIVFESVSRGGRLAVHRVVEADAAGLVTQGDANPHTDQQAGEPLVTPDRVRGRVLTREDGTPFTVPGLGLVVIEGRALYRSALVAAGSPALAAAYAALAVAVALLLVPAPSPLAPSRPRGPRQSLAAALWRRAFPRGVLARHATVGTCALILGSTGLAAALAATELPMSMVVTDSPPAGQARSAAPGEAVPREFEFRANPLLPTFIVIESGGPNVRLEEPLLRLAPGEVRRVTVEEVAGERLGVQHDHLRVSRYPAYLPAETTLALHGVLAGAPIYLFGFALAAALAAWAVSLGVGNVPVRLLLRSAPVGGTPR